MLAALTKVDKVEHVIKDFLQRLTFAFAPQLELASQNIALVTIVRAGKDFTCFKVISTKNEYCADLQKKIKCKYFVQILKQFETMKSEIPKRVLREKPVLRVEPKPRRVIEPAQTNELKLEAMALEIELEF